MAERAAGFILKQEDAANRICKYWTNLLKLGRNKMTVSVLEQRKLRLDQYWDLYVTRHYKIVNLKEAQDLDYIVLDSFATVEEKYFEVSSLIAEALAEAKTVLPTAEATPAAVMQQFQLPKLSLPSFSGDQLHWETFRDLFKSLVHDVTGVPDVQKLQHLKASLTGVAADVIRNVPITGDGYVGAWAALVNRYDNKRLIFFSHLRNLLNSAPATKQSSTEIKRLLDVTLQTRRAFISLERAVQYWDDWFVHLLVLKLDTTTRMYWETSLADSSDFPTLDELTTFLETRARALEAARSNDSTPRTTSTRDNKVHEQQASTGGGSRTSSVHTATAKRNPKERAAAKCPLCQEKHHLCYCPKFKGMNCWQRKDQASNCGACFNCLHMSHSADKCPSENRCIVCSNKHHSMIHNALNKNPPTQSAKTSSDLAEGTSSTTTLTSSTDYVSHVADTPASKTATALTASTRNVVLLATAQIQLQSPSGKLITVRALLDTASDTSFVTEWVAQSLQLPRKRVVVPTSGLQGADTGTATSEVTVTIRARQNPSLKLPIQALVLGTLTRQLPADRIALKPWPHVTDLNLADPGFAVPARIDAILGAEVCGHLLGNDIRKGPPGTPTAVLTVFGWILLGSTDAETRSAPTQRRASVLHCSNQDCLATELQKFWEIEEVTLDRIESPANVQCEEHFRKRHSRDNTGRYIVRLPLRDDDSVELGPSRQAALGMLLDAERGFLRKPEMKEKYCNFMQEYLKLGHMGKAPPANTDPSRTFYMPHHAVVKAHDPTRKIRVVFNASLRTSTGFSLNDRLHPEPRLQSDLWLVLTRLRLFRFAFTTDIVKMFRQIRIHPEDTDWQRILWRNSPSDDLNEYRLTTVTYGTTSAPFLALRVLLQLAKDEGHRFPLGAKAIEHHSYVDDILAGADKLEQAVEIKRQLTEILAAGGFPLSRWGSSSTELSSEKHSETRVFQEPESISTLGMTWNPSEDCFSVRVNAKTAQLANVTKRVALSEVACLFDPLGWVAPVIIFGKIFIQDLWLTGVDWDQPVPQRLSEAWIRFRSTLHELESIQIPRWTAYLNSESVHAEIHGFSDASERAYAAAVYLRVIDADNRVNVNLLVAKTKVAPTAKPVSVPRLELCGAVLLTRLINTLKKGLDFSLVPTYAWCDSQVTLAWIQGHPSRWKPFVANRVAEVQETLPAASWRYVRTGSNPADAATRGIAPSELLASKLWWHGPDWLQKLGSEWKSCPITPDGTEETELRRAHTHHVLAEAVPNELLTRYSDLTKLLRITAFCLRFTHNARNQGQKRLGSLTTRELNQARKTWIRVSQQSTFAKELTSLSRGEPTSRDSSLKALRPFLDEEGLIRTGGRLQNAPLDYNEKNPYILAKSCHLSTLLVQDAHTATLHGGQQLTRGYLLRQFWILRNRSLVRTVVRKCVRCARFSGNVGQQLMGQLPASRIKPERPFLASGVDYAGPIQLRTTKGRGHKSYKGYICLFVCLATEAVHLEVVSDLSSASFVSAFKRFISRRGRCAHLMSDNGTNFRGADAELRAMFRSASAFYQEAAFHLTRDGTSWAFIPPHTPHFGGLWEAGVKSVKHHLRRVLGDHKLTFEEMSTLLCQIEACLNSCPLYPISNDPTDLTPLTPGHFLVGDTLIAIPESSPDSNPSNLASRWKLITNMRDHFWRRWSREYIHNLQQLGTWRSERPNLEIGRMVLIKDELLPPTKWALARITKLHPGPDSLVRVVTARTARGEITRPIVKICPLPVLQTEDANGD